MTSTRFDGVVRSLDAARSRRGALAAILGGLSGLLLIGGPDVTSAKRKKGRRKRRRRKDRRTSNGPCGNGGKKEGKDCRCMKQGETCTNDANCCPKTQGLSCQEGTCQPCDVCRSGCEFDSIQEAIDTFAPAQTIHICPGTFGERLAITGDVTLVGVGDGADGTTIDGLQGGTTVVVTGATATFERLRITGGANPGGTGGGIKLRNATMTLTKCTVSGNTAEHGAGICVVDSTLTLNDSRVTDNVATDSGGGIAKENGGLTLLINSVVADNEAGVDGGGIFHKAGTTIHRNESGSRGGGIFFNDGAMSIFDGSLVEGNTAGTEGGGVFRVAGAISVQNSTVTGNSPDNCAGNVGNCTNP